MKNSIITLSLILTLGSVLVSCSHQETGAPERYVASEGCKVKGEYHAYFDEVEKCIEKEEHK
jgi:hypothetical protein